MFFYSELYLGGNSGGFQIIEGDMSANIEDELSFELEATIAVSIEAADIQFALDEDFISADIEELDDLTADIIEEFQAKIEGGFSVND